MKVFAIGDLHFSTAVNKPMDIFGERWINHQEKIIENWKQAVGEDDVVFVVGDISWGTKIPEGKADLDIIKTLPGKKYFVRGNHDYWWSTASAMNRLYPDDDKMNFLNINYVTVGKYAVCSTRGWMIPTDERFEEGDMTIYKREANRLRLSIEQAKKDGYEEFIVLMHYPPTNCSYVDTLFLEVIEQYQPKYVIYGHMHGEENFSLSVHGEHKGVSYHLVSSDYLNFVPKEILEID